MRIGTWNVEYADSIATNARRSAVMAKYPADIWVLTETHDALIPPGDFYVVHADQRPLYGKRVRENSRWVSIWSRFPATRIDLEGADLERTTVALVEGPRGQLIIYGTVMPWGGDKGRFGQNEQASGWSEHHRVIPLQIAEWKELQSRYNNAPLCVAGDLNTDLVSGAYYGTKRGIEMLKTGMDDCGLFCATEPLRLMPGSLACLPIDHILLPMSWQSNTRVVGAWEGRVGSPRLSDHSGLMVEIAF